MKHIAVLLTGLAAAFAASAASAGVYVELVSREISTDTRTPAMKMYVQGGNGRFIDEEGRASIVKGDTMYVIDDSDKTYVMFDKAAMAQLAQQIKAGMEKMKDQLAKLPPEQRAPLEALMNGGGEDKWTVEAVDTGKSDKVDGRACKVWDIKRNGEIDDQLCVVPFAQLPGKENFQQVFANFSKVFEEMAKSVPMLGGMMTNEFSAQAKVNGFPFRTRGYEDGKLGDEEQLVTVWREEAVPASMFEVPAGYKQKQMTATPGAF